jgi:hypothetical protein
MKKIILIILLIFLASCDTVKVDDKGDIAICDSFKKMCEAHNTKCDTLEDKDRFTCYSFGNSCLITADSCYKTQASTEMQKLLTRQKAIMIDYWQLMEK